MSGHLHHIIDGVAVCTAPVDAACRVYPACDCEHFTPDLHGDTPAPGHERVPQTTCLLLDWVNGPGDLALSYAADDLVGMTGTIWPDGAIDTTWEDDYLTWDYAEPGVEPYSEDDQ